jgi:hypothetical protein
MYVLDSGPVLTNVEELEQKSDAAAQIGDSLKGQGKTARKTSSG